MDDEEGFQVRIPAGVAMVSRWRAKCMECGKHYDPGSKIIKMSSCAGDWAHAQCPTGPTRIARE